MPAQIEDYYKRIQKKDLLDEQKGKRKAEMLAIAREYYGYNIDYRDPKYLNFYLLKIIKKQTIKFSIILKSSING